MQNTQILKSLNCETESRAMTHSKKLKKKFLKGEPGPQEQMYKTAVLTNTKVYERIFRLKLVGLKVFSKSSLLLTNHAELMS